MRAVIQRVSKASVNIDSQTVAKINKGLLILLGIKKGDTLKEAEILAKKTAHLRIFGDENDKMNLSMVDIKAEAIVVSQFTLYANCKKGRRPSFIEAASPEIANELYSYFGNCLVKEGVKIQTGIFQTMMQVCILNEGPVTIILDSEEIQKS